MADGGSEREKRWSWPAAIGVPAVTAIGALAAAYVGGFLDVRRTVEASAGTISLEKLKYSNSLIDRALESDEVESRARALLFYADVGLLDGLNVENIRTYANREIERIESGSGGSSFLPSRGLAPPAAIALDESFMREYAPEASDEIVRAFTGIGNFILRGAEISATPARLAAFLGQIKHESGDFRFTEEAGDGSLWEGRRYLGNTEPGDGERFKGRGFMMLTGRENYRTMSVTTGVDLLSNPEMLKEPNVGLLVAAAFWTSRELNTLADTRDWAGITRRISGGTNGLDDRVANIEQALALIERQRSLP